MEFIYISIRKNPSKKALGDYGCASQEKNSFDNRTAGQYVTVCKES